MNEFISLRTDDRSIDRETHFPSAESVFWTLKKLVCVCVPKSVSVCVCVCMCVYPCLANVAMSQHVCSSGERPQQEAGPASPV